MAMKVEDVSIVNARCSVCNVGTRCVLVRFSGEHVSGNFAICQGCEGVARVAAGFRYEVERAIRVAG